MEEETPCSASPAPGQAPWRVGRKVGRTIYDANDVLIGVMDTPGLAARVVHAVNLSAPRAHTIGGGGSAGRVVVTHDIVPTEEP